MPVATSSSRTIFDKILAANKIPLEPVGQSLLFVDRHYLDETCFTCFETLARRDLPVRRPDLSFMMIDHTIPTSPRLPHRVSGNPEIRNATRMSVEFAERHGIRIFGPNDLGQGINHVVMPEMGLTLPGMVVACSDSHTSTHGGIGALGLGVGLSEQTHILATQTTRFPQCPTMRIELHGQLSEFVSAKDVILYLIGRIGADGASGHFVEFVGRAVEELPVEGRMTLCNMIIEAGAKAGIVAPDDKTFAWIEGRPHAPQGSALEIAKSGWRELRSDSDARFDRILSFDAGEIAPHVTWGTSPAQVLPVDAAVPDPDSEMDQERRASMSHAMDYMGLQPGMKLAGLPVDRVFIGSCTNGRLSDLQAAAKIVRGRRAVVPAIVVPGSMSVKRRAEAEGLDRIFLDAGFEWHDAGCSLCVGMNGDTVPSGQRCASTSNRNFRGRQGPGSRTHLMSPAMAAAAACTGHIVDVRGEKVFLG